MQESAISFGKLLWLTAVTVVACCSLCPVLRSSAVGGCRPREARVGGAAEAGRSAVTAGDGWSHAVTDDADHQGRIHAAAIHGQDKRERRRALCVPLLSRSREPFRFCACLPLSLSQLHLLDHFDDGGSCHRLECTNAASEAADQEALESAERALPPLDEEGELEQQEEAAEMQ
jgi:hypothetical protein